MPKTIITCAITGAVHTPTMSDALPVNAEMIAEQAIAAAKAGAAILHLHARHPETGAPTVDPEHFAEFLPAIRAETDAVINISTGGNPVMTVEERIPAARRYSPEMCSLNMGSMNFALHPMADRYETWKNDWEKDYLKGSENNIFRNTFTDIRMVAEALGGPEHRVKFEHECYDVGHLYNLKFCLDRGMFTAPIFLQFVMGILGGIAADIENLVFMKRTADKLFGDAYQWSVIGAGGQQMRMAAVGAQMGGHVRVGLEDSLYISRGKLATSNAQQVEKVRGILEMQGNQIASPDEARAILGLKGSSEVKF
ncbi:MULTISPECIES: 3-keto-5-aminohexanoate cleavage protein [Sulfitobacter]|uniref:3-keto-5-aminohexanoate cleavage protein n=1 Tax=Sulfitobacter TaxID=60136 RepID=UPI0023080698|nr:MULTISPECIES: 3-keto-5-aminohexanoate cleavage protein [Sulfitobacter]MDF3384795.1 3-keto-5-aminohexanoate cleavage protein [Sulfitobacter sp. Ks11]MDF3388213.1 3-keto-5-aminohexanoate cleavage protein [Sulfitobacter sp. M85]MDF3391634.1 3-keto-5-aminohexanoate cleavage protein [Sulfitobacter sp. Ks16]MDF3402271.1 3-keto-5-aminohexanoate cleavage protein [Sulfitobacter sp. KE39]MDF3405692.1 3-keto-5-aminohexanoate cleavage protein [Sulfitobacter sp. Ks35]